jgi:hypothetical protein
MSAYKDNFIKNIKKKIINNLKINAPHTKTEEEKTHFFDILGPLHILIKQTKKVFYRTIK